MMGSPTNEFGRDDDEAQHQVVLTNGYWLGKYPVTQKQWVSVMGDNPSRHQGKDEFPVDYVSWEDCHKFITKINAIMGCEARMPTEAEWEYACRAGTSSSYGGTGKLDEMGWYDGNRIKSLPVGEWSHIVGQKKPNGYGLYDMHGNMAEWCADWYGDYPTGKVINPTGPASGRYRVLRGGSWRQDDLYCRSAGRSYGSPDFRDNIFGFRLCCSAGTHFMDSREVKCDSNCQSGRQISNTIPFAPTGVKVVERESSWVVSSREHSSATGYNGVRFSKSKCDGDKAVVTFLHNYGTDAQKAEYAASGKPCPSDWKRKK